MEFGQRIKDARVQRQLTQDQVAEKFFVTRQTISNWEKEKSYPDIASLIKISDYYHISLDTLLKEDTGMREYLEKKEITKNVKPVYNVLLIVDVILFLISMISIFTDNNLEHLSLVVTILLLLVSYAAAKLRTFGESNSLGLMTKMQKQIIKYKYTIPIIFIAVGTLSLVFKFIFPGIELIIAGIAIIVMFVIRKRP